MNYLHAAAPGEPLPYIAVEGNFFVDNFVGIYMGGPGKVDAFIAGNGFYNVEPLLPPFAGQSAAPLGLPEQNGFSLAGIYVDEIRTPLSYPKNAFSGLASGIVLNSASGSVSRSTFESIEFGAYPDYAFDGEAATSRGTGGTTLSVEKCVFTNCNAGIVAAEVALEAVSNTMDEVRYGISASLSNAGAVTIGGEGDKRNIIRQSKVGILVNHRGTGPVAITENEVSVSGADWGWGIALLFHHAPTLAKKNTVEAYGATTGMLLLSCSDADLFGNIVTLMDMPEAYRGISLGNAYGCRLRENSVTGQGAGGSENIGIALQFSPGNIYCCNTVDQTRIGVRVVDGCQAEDNFRGTIFGDHATALLLDGTGILGTQEHMKNRWTGNGGVEYQVLPDQAQDYQFIVDNTPSNGLPEYFPPSVIPSIWFDPQEDEDEQDVCLTENCIIDGFTPESPDSKRIAKGEIDVGEHTDIIQWHLSRFLYRKLKGYTGEDEDILDFIETGGGNLVGAFDALEEGIEALLSDDLENQLQVQANLALISARLKEVSVLDSLYLEADEAGQDSLWLLRGQLLDALATLALETSGLNEAVNHQRSLSAASLIGQNAGIETTEVYEQNLKTVNDIYLNYLMDGFGGMPAEELSVLEGIALQCPLEGGSAVFSARALLAVATRQVSWHEDLECGEAQRLSGSGNAQLDFEQAVRVYPNPAKGQITVDWKNFENQVIWVQLSDIYGKIHREIAIEPGMQSLVLPTSGLNAGLYMIRIRLPSGETTKKVIIHP